MWEVAAPSPPPDERMANDPRIAAYDAYVDEIKASGIGEKIAMIGAVSQTVGHDAKQAGNQQFFASEHNGRDREQEIEGLLDR